MGNQQWNTDARKGIIDAYVLNCLIRHRPLTRGLKMTAPFGFAFSKPGEGQLVNALGRHVMRITGAATTNAVAIWETFVQPGEGAPLHVHEREEEIFYVMKGQFQFWCGDDTVLIDEGGTMALPRGIPHRYQNMSSDEGHLLVAAVPGGFERFFMEAEEQVPLSIEETVTLAAKFGVTLLPQENG